VVGERFARLLDDVGEGALPDKHHDGELGVAPGACEEAKDGPSFRKNRVSTRE
jgi:hypothetical protein